MVNHCIGCACISVSIWLSIIMIDVIHEGYITGDDCSGARGSHRSRAALDSDGKDASLACLH